MNGARTAAAAVLAVYLVFLAGLTFRPAGTEQSQPDVRVNVRPLATIGPALRSGPGSFSFRVLVGNVVAFIPLGVLVPLVRPRSSAAFVLLAGAGVSALVELGQLGVSLYANFGFRAADVDDLLLNTLGTLIGLLLVSGAVRWGAASPNGQS